MEPDLNQAPEPKWPSAAASVFVWHQAQLEPACPTAQSAWEIKFLNRELEAAQAELESLQALLEEIPEIFERKFEQRLQPLLVENQALRHQVRQLQQALPQPTANPRPGQALFLPKLGNSSRSRFEQVGRFGQVIRHAFALPGGESKHESKHEAKHEDSQAA